MANAMSATTPIAIQTQGQMFRISIGGLMSRRASGAAFVILFTPKKKSENSHVLSYKDLNCLQVYSSSSQPPAFASFEKLSQRGGIGLVGAELDRIDAGSAEHARDVGLCFGLALGKCGAFAGVTGADFDNLAGFGVFQHEAAERGQFEFAGIGDLHGHDIVTAIRLAQHREGGLRERFEQHQLRAEAALALATGTCG